MYRNRTSASVTLSWYPPSPETHNGVIRSYLVNVTEEESGESFLLRPTQTEITVSQLHPYYNYSFEVSATTILAGPFSVPLTVETLEDGELNSCLVCEFMTCDTVEYSIEGTG